MPGPPLHEVLTRHAATIALARNGIVAGDSLAEAAVEMYDAAREAAGQGSLPGLRLRRLPSVTHLLQTFRFRDPPGPRVTESGGLERGRAIHLACQLDDEGTLDEASVDEQVAPFLAQFRRWRDDMGGRSLSIFWERDIEHPRFGYKGRCDNVRWLRGRRSLIDIKTNESDAATALQLALYDHLIAHETGTPADEWHALVLRPKTYRWRRIVPEEMPQHRTDALALVRTYHALARMRGVEP